MKNLTLAQAAFLAEKAERLFNRAATAWVRGNNSGDMATNTRCVIQCAKLRSEAEALLSPLGIEVDYPGLYPSFTVKGYAEYSVMNAISAAESETVEIPMQGRTLAEKMAESEAL